jgi:hypothetical protein
MLRDEVGPFVACAIDDACFLEVGIATLECLETILALAWRRNRLRATRTAAGLMIHQFTRWLRDLPVDPDMTLNLLAGELIQA